jgi:hypothetical protein
MDLRVAPGGDDPSRKLRAHSHSAEYVDTPGNATNGWKINDKRERHLDRSDGRQYRPSRSGEPLYFAFAVVCFFCLFLSLPVFAVIRYHPHHPPAPFNPVPGCPIHRAFVSSDEWASFAEANDRLHRIVFRSLIPALSLFLSSQKPPKTNKTNELNLPITSPRPAILVLEIKKNTPATSWGVPVFTERASPLF